MSLDQIAASPTSSRETRFSGLQLRLSRTFWVLCLVLGVGLYIGALPVYFASLHKVVAEAALGAQQLTPTDVRALHTLGLSLDFYVWLTLSVNVILLLVYVLVGVVLFWRASSDRMALLASFSLVLFPVALNGQIVGLLPPVFTVPIACVSFLGSVSLGLFFYLFPGGRFVPRWTGFLAVVWIGFWATQNFLPSGSFLLSLLGLLILLALLISQLALQLYRYRCVSTPTERQQTKWVVFGLVVAFGGILLGQAILFVILPLVVPVDPLTSALGQTLSTLLLLFFPLSIGFAILRYRLWDIDLIINRTLVYGALTASVVGIYSLVVGGLGTLLQTHGNLGLSLLGTCLIVMLIQPLHTRLQRAMNRLMYGERDDPYRVISRLGQHLEATLAPDAVLPTIVETVAHALKLPYVALTLQQDGTGTLVTPYGVASNEEELVRIPLIHHLEQIGELVLAPRGPSESFTTADRALLYDLARQAAVAVHTMRLTTDRERLTMDLQHSRQHLVTAREEERRRLRRDLHDGLGPTLGAFTVTVGSARYLYPRDPVAADALLEKLERDIAATVTDIRRLAYALRPPALDNLGLVDAIQAYAAQYSAADDESSGTISARSLMVVLDAPTSLPALPAAVEVAAYRIVQEALTNVARYAQASTCTISIAFSDLLELEIKDDGVGLPANRHAGVGLLSMCERADELGGTCEIDSEPGKGTRVVARLPLGEDGAFHAPLVTVDLLSKKHWQKERKHAAD